MTESIKFGPEWLRNSVANVSSSTAPNSTSSLAPASDSITSRPVLSDHRYGREEMLSLCDKSSRLPDVLTRFRRLYVTEWQMPLALLPNTDDERGLGTSATWGTTHIRPLMPGVGRGGAGIIRGGSVERGRGRGRGLYHGSAGYARSTSLYDEEGRRTNLWLDRNGTDTTEWSGSGSAISPRKEFSRGGPGGMENWRKGTRDESGGAPGEIDWRSSNNGTATAREKWARSTSWREGEPGNDQTGHSNGQQQSTSPPNSGGVSQMPSSGAPSKPPTMYKKSWDEDHLPEWATESFDYGGTFDSSGAFHDDGRDPIAPDDAKPVKAKARQEVKKEDPVVIHEEEPIKEPSPALNHFDPRSIDAPVPSKFMDFLNERETQQHPNFNAANHNPNFNGSAPNTSNHQHIDRMQEVADLVANLVMEDDSKDVKQAPAPNPLAGQPATVDWFYRDPQGDTQGAFTAQDMSEWYKAGYFQESLMVRRSIDNAFMPLGQLVKVYGRTAPFMAAVLMEPIQPPPPPPVAVPVEIDQYRIQQQRMVPPPDVNGWSMMTPEQQIVLLNMRLAHQRPSVPDPYVMKQAAPTNVASSMDLRRMMGGGANEFYQAPVPSNIQPAASTQEMDPIQQLLMQLQKTGGNGSGMHEPQQWMKAAAPAQMIPTGGNNMEMIPPAAQGMNQQQIPNTMHQNQVPSQNNWNQAPMSIWDMPKVDPSVPQQLQQRHQMATPTSQNQVHEHHTMQSEQDNGQNGVDDSQSSQFQTATSKSHESKKKKQKESEIEQKKQLKEPTAQQKQNAAGGKKKPGVNEKQQQKKEERSTQPAAPAPWVGQAPANGASLAKIQKTEAQRRQGEMVAQRERDHQKIELLQKIDMQKNDGLKWAAPPTARVKTLDEIQAEEQKAASIQQERENVAYAKREAAKKEASVVMNDVSIWNSTPHSMAWQQPKVWSGEQTSGSGFWEEPAKSSLNPGKNAQLLSKSQTMATITTTKKHQQQQQQQQAPAQVKKQAPPARKPTGEKKEKKDDNNNEFTTWCTRTLCSMNGNVDGK